MFPEVREVTFPSSDPLSLAEARSGKAEGRRCAARLYVPADVAKGPFPAVVISQGLGGPRERREYDYARRLAEAGIVALVPDGFGARGVGKQSDAIRAAVVTTAMLVADAFAGLKFLRGQSFVNPDRIAIIGFSFGGMVAVLSAYEQVRRSFLDGEPGFAGHASFYGCSIPRMEDPATTGAPVLMLLGGKDRNVSIRRSRRIAEDLRHGGSPVEFVIFGDAYHEWDGPDSSFFIPYRLKRCRVRIDRDGEARDERTGLAIGGRLALAWFMIFNGSVFGFRIKRDEAVLERSNALLARFLERAFGGSAEGGGADGEAMEEALDRRVTGTDGEKRSLFQRKS